MSLPEAFEMEEYCRERPGQTMAGMEFLSKNPHYRLVLEGLVPGSNGNLYEEVPNENGCLKLPYHIGMERKYYLHYTKDYAGIQYLLELLMRLYGTPGATTVAGLKDARARFDELTEDLGDPDKALDALSEYYEHIVESVPELEDEFPGSERVSLDDNGRPLKTGGVTTRFQLIHKAHEVVKPDWVWSQDFPYRGCYFKLKSVKKLEDLKPHYETIRQWGEDKTYNSPAISALWAVYQGRKKYLISKEIEYALQVGGFTCRRMIRNIMKYDSLGAIYNNVITHLQGEFVDDVWTPCDLTEREEAVVWMAFNVRKKEVE